jgi:hypothetical protein
VLCKCTEQYRAEHDPLADAPNELSTSRSWPQAAGYLRAGTHPPHPLAPCLFLQLESTNRGLQEKLRDFVNERLTITRTISPDLMNQVILTDAHWRDFLNMFNQAHPLFLVALNGCYHHSRNPIPGSVASPISLYQTGKWPICSE